MKHFVKSLTASVLAACTLFSQSALCANAAQDSKAQRLAEVYAEYERLAAEMNVTPIRLNSDENISKVPTKYISYIMMKTDVAYGEVTMQMTHQYNALNYSGTTNGPYGTVLTSYDNVMTYPTYKCGATADILLPTGSDHTKLIFRQNFTAYGAGISGVHSELGSSSPSYFSYPEITSAYIYGFELPESLYSTYFDRGFWALGDLNGNTLVESAEYDELMRYIAGYPVTLTELQKVLLDMDGDGTVTVMDAVQLTSYLNS